MRPAYLLILFSFTQGVAVNKLKKERRKKSFSSIIPKWRKQKRKKKKSSKQIMMNQIINSIRRSLMNDEMESCFFFTKINEQKSKEKTFSLIYFVFGMVFFFNNK